jgi:hypothetical protein
LDLQGAREELLLAVGLAAALHPAEQLEATAEPLLMLSQTLLLVAAQAEAADLASPAMQATAATAEPTVALAEAEALRLITLEILEQAETEQMALLLSQPIFNELDLPSFAYDRNTPRWPDGRPCAGGGREMPQH